MGCHIVKEFSSLTMNNINKNNKDMQIDDPAAAAAKSELPQTQTQPNAWSQMDSQPIENVVWGRLYPKNIKVKSLGIRSRMSIQIENASSTIGNTRSGFYFLTITFFL